MNKGICRYRYSYRYVYVDLSVSYLGRRGIHTHICVYLSIYLSISIHLYANLRKHDEVSRHLAGLAVEDMYIYISLSIHIPI